MSNDLVRFSVAMPEGLLMEFDQLVARRGLAKNRSEVVRDLVRDALVEEECATPGGLVMGTLTIIYDHHSNDLQEKLHTIQHDYFDTIISTMHVHVDEHMCLEVIVMRGETGLVQSVANLILGTKGVKNGKLVLTTKVCRHRHKSAVRTVLRHAREFRIVRKHDHAAMRIVILSAHHVITFI